MISSMRVKILSQCLTMKSEDMRLPKTMREANDGFLPLPGLVFFGDGDFVIACIGEKWGLSVIC